ncbi:MAG TPA: hypothetical protein VGB53_02705 [Rubricoccaceae bacterium]|jgi:hypothetical protein
MEEHTIAIVASNLTAAYFSGVAPGAAQTSDADAERFTAVIGKYHEFSAALREHVRQQYEHAQREEEQIEEEQDDVDKPIHVY